MSQASEGSATVELPRTDQIDFARGFLISPAGRTASFPSWWREEAFDDVVVASDPRVEWTASSDGTVALLGHAIDVTHGGRDLREIVEGLSRGLRASASDFQAAADVLCGRFVILSSDAAGTHLQSDAVGLRSTFFTTAEHPPYLASHEALVARQIDAGPSVFGAPRYLRENNLPVMPGRATRYAGVKVLTPNTSLNLQSRATTRIFDGGGIRPLSPYDAAGVVIDDSHAQHEALRRMAPLRLSLSAGLDSRVTAVLLRPLLDDIEFFTYELSYRPRTNADRYDLTASKELAERFGLNHRVLDIDSPDVDPAVKKALAGISAKSHSRALASSYYEQLQDGLHIRSHVYEIARSSYRRGGFEDTPLTGAGLLTMVSKRKSTDRDAVAAFEEYIEETGFGAVDAMDPLDLFYWEHRVGYWMVPVVSESSIAHETHVLINSRHTLTAMLGIEEPLRRVGAVSDEIVTRLWPEMFDLPVNGMMRSLTR
ncbi:asparagine synthase-related protein [Rothia sp. AR01]|uniref:Asparagine synthase-related protein n=1 Tax=Rothia santali TaxID=2949643 RepID=A0A9X2HAS3_9MICC|nr:asparagine synthase-related protein [Rothia santali]MCP3426209.1 asparagine synthase-related protein [Rothia santali]